MTDSHANPAPGGADEGSTPPEVSACAAAPALSDDELMLLAKTGRTDAFALLMRRHQKLVLGLAVRYLGDRAAGRDVAQDVFLSLWADSRAASASPPPRWPRVAPG